VQDLSTYYLLGYYSANEALDGKWRTIKARVIRPGVTVRARKGYRALRPEDLVLAGEASRTAADGGAGATAAAAESAALASALGVLAGVRDQQPWRTRAAWFFYAASGAAMRTGRLWVTAELDPATIREEKLTQGGVLSVAVTTAAGVPVGQAEVALVAGARAVAAEIATTTAPIEAADLIVRLRLNGGSLPLTDTLRVGLPDAAAPVGTARLLRASAATRQQFVATADPRFRRHEKVRVEIPLAAGATAVSAELLDQTGKPMTAIPVASALRPVDDGGLGWASADVGLAPLSAGDYVLRVSVTTADGTTRTMAGFRLIP